MGDWQSEHEHRFLCTSRTAAQGCSNSPLERCAPSVSPTHSTSPRCSRSATESGRGGWRRVGCSEVMSKMGHESSALALEKHAKVMERNGTPASAWTSSFAALIGQ